MTHDAAYRYEVKSSKPIDPRFVADCFVCGEPAKSSVIVGRVENTFGSEYDLCPPCKVGALDVHANEMEKAKREADL